MENRFSPDSTYRIECSEHQMAMSHSTFTPVVYRNRDRAQLFDMGSDLWSLQSIEWLSDSTVVLKTWMYPGRMFCDLTLDLLAKTGQATRGSFAYFHWQPGEPLIQAPITFEGSLAEIQQWVSNTGPLKRLR